MLPAANPNRRVVVTGMGCVTPLGGDYPSTWEAAVAGRSGCGTITAFDPSGYPCRIAGEVQGELDPGDFPRKEVRRFDRVVALALAAAREAMQSSGLVVDDTNRDRIGVAMGSGIGGVATIINNYQVLLDRGPKRVSPFTIPMGIANMPAGMISVHYGLRGPNLCHVSACATGAHSIGEGAEVILRGQADVMVVGGAEAPVIDVAISGFGNMRALSLRNDDPQRASRPFDVDRDGFVMGEGAGVLVLESLESAQARGAHIHAEIAGYGATADAVHIVQPDPDGGGAARCMLQALERGGLSPQDIGHVNAHATSTPAGDPVEARALRTVFGSHLDQLPISATKSMTGHLLGAAGAVEGILCIGALEYRELPPTINLDRVDPECELDHVANKSRAAAPRFVLSNSFGFGGTNATLIFGAHEA
jgi:3-oxoacyl-[acyl-carrier-protein] synthase II